jgi:hypothetical protein
MKKFLKNKTFGDPSPEEMEFHIQGYCMLTGDDPFERGQGIRDEEAARESWERCQDFIMSLQNIPINDHHKENVFVWTRGGNYFELFERPASWYKYDAPKKVPNYWHGFMTRPEQKKYLLAYPKLLTALEREALRKPKGGE